MASVFAEKKTRIGQAIKSARLRKGLSQEQAAALVKTSRFQWIRWEKGENTPGLLYAQRIADALGIDQKTLELYEDEEAALSGDTFRGGARPDVRSAARGARGASGGAGAPASVAGDADLTEDAA